MTTKNSGGFITFPPFVRGVGGGGGRVGGGSDAMHFLLELNLSKYLNLPFESFDQVLYKIYIFRWYTLTLPFYYYI